MKRLRLVKATVQLTLVADDGEALSEVVTKPFEVSAADWPAIVERVARELTEHEKRMNDMPATDADAPSA